jgi:asparagine synthase (glutamine-hydrolysing)
LLARDRAGIKPLYYAPLRDGGVAFASELSALLLHPGVERSLDPAGLASYFFADYVHPPHTMVKGARKLAPGQFLHWTCGAAAEPRPFWSAASASSSNGHATDAPDVAREVLSRLDAAVASQMVADVPVGVFLSGGIDSSLVTALAARHSDHPLTTFSIGFADPQFDESRYARQVSAHVRTRHVEHTYTEAELLGSLDDALDCLDEPLADPSILPTYTLSKLAARHVKVVLGGDGGDELWGGYPTYKAHRLAAAYRHVPRLIRAALVAPVVARLPVGRGYQSFDWKVKRFALRWDDDPVLRHLRWMSNVDLPDLARALTASPGVPHSLRSASTAVGREARSVGQMLALDFKTYLPGSVLTKVDRAGMAHGLEVRPPMLDNTMIDLAFAVPASLKLQGGKAKALLKRAAAGLLPHEIIHRRKKGFAIPLSRWIAGPLMARVRAVVDSSPLWETGFLDRDVFAGWLKEHSVRSHDRSRPLWAAFVLDRWYRSTLAT